MKKTIGILLLVLLIFSFAQAADFLRGTRGAGVGFSYFLLADDPSGALYNPSGLAFIKGLQTQLMYEKMADYGYATSENPYSGQFGFVYYRPHTGTFALNTEQTGSFSKLTNIATVNHAVFSYGRQLGNSLAAGGSVKYLSESGFGKRSAYDFDIAASYRSDFGFFSSVAVENISRSTLSPEYLGVQENLPRRTRLGAGYSLSGNSYEGAFLLAGQAEESGITHKYTTSLVNFATEWWFLQNHDFSIGARAGYTSGNAMRNDIKSDYSGPSAGISLNYKLGINDLRIDYGYQAYPFKTFDGSNPGNHFVSLTFGWGGMPNYSRQERVEAPKLVRPKQEPPKPRIFQEPQTDQSEKPLVDKDTNFKGENYLRFDVQMEVSDISSMDLKRIVFYVRPQQVLKTTSWKLFVFKAKIKSWNEEETSRWALAVIEGKGVPPINIIWDGMDTKGELVPKGKYYYVLTAVDLKGQNYATAWFDFKLE